MEMRYARGRTWPPGAVVCALTIALLAAGGRVCAQGQACADAAIATAIEHDLTALFRTQRTTGEMVFSAENEFFSRYPLLATFVLQAVRDGDNPAFVSRSSSAIARYYGYLFTTDEGANLMLERSVRAGKGEILRAEDVGFNSLLARDLMSLSRLYMKRRQPHTALYWYEGARTIEKRVVSAAYDPQSYEFFNKTIPDQVRIPTDDVLATLPVMFKRELGQNVAERMMDSYGLERARRAAGAERADIGSALRALLAAEALEGCGYRSEAREVRASADAGTQRTGALAGPAASHRVVACALRTGRPMFDDYVSLRLFGELVRKQRQLADNEIVRTARAIDGVIAFLTTPDTSSTTELAAHETAVRNAYWSVSRTRDQLREGTFFSAQDAVELTAVNASAAMERLLDDATAVLQRAETRIFEERFRSSGLYISMSVNEDRLIAGNSLEATWKLSALKNPIELAAVVAHSDQFADTLVFPAKPVVVPAGGHIELTKIFNPPFKRVGGLETISTGLTVEDGSGRRARFNLATGIYVDEPVSVLAAFPRGRTLVGSVLPIELTIVKRLQKAVTFEYSWYSPSGLRPREGTAAKMFVPQGADTVVAGLGIVVPEQCRPGTFPVRLKFKANGRDVGMINSTLFKPYQWIFVGPLAVGDRPMSKRYAPELKVDLLADYSGVGTRTSWRLLGESALLGNGTISLRDEMNAPGVGYLYTVIASDSPTETPATLSANVPSALFINGKRVLEGLKTMDEPPAYERVKLIQGLNEILIKVYGDETSQVYFNLGGDATTATAEFGNNLWELIDGFAEIYDRSKLLRAGDGSEVQRIVVLRYDDPQANSVSVIGSFNGWSPDQSHMQKSKRGGWEITLSLSPGKYAYRFLVNNRKQVLDPECPLVEPDGYGGSNSIIVVE